MNRNMVTVPLAATAGLALGWLLHQKMKPCRQEVIEQAAPAWSLSRRQFRTLRGVLYSTQKTVLAVSKALRKPTP